MPRNVLLLQGPVGPFFRKFATQLEDNGHNVLKVNLNGGDLYFYRHGNYVNYDLTLSDWQFWIESLMVKREIERIYLFGDCRRYHRQAIAIARRLEIEVYVFEEGYVRPNYTTLEKGGVNGHSTACKKDLLPAKLEATDTSKPDRTVPSAPVNNVFLSAACSAMKYYMASSAMRWKFSGYEHHRALRTFSEGSYWIRSGVRKFWYKLSERKTGSRLFSGDEKYFLVPLQVHNDTQVTRHSDYGCVEEFIERVIISFAGAAPDGCLVFKHHPYDRGYKSYKKLIKNLATEHKVRDRVLYVHDTDLPQLLQNAEGAILINSTVGISSLYHQTPVMAMGNAIYDMPGLTHQGSLEAFWQNPGQVDKELFQKFRQYLIRNTQVNGSVYSDIEGSTGASGMIWSAEMFKTHVQATHHNVIDLDERRAEEQPMIVDTEDHNKVAV